MMRSLTSESTILPKAAPMITPTARSTTLPLTANSRNSLKKLIGLPSALRALSDGRLAGLPGADADHLLDRRHEDLPVADLARARRANHGLDRAVDHVVGQDDFDAHLRQEI